MGHKHKHAERDAFIKKHFDEIAALVDEGKYFSTKIQEFVNGIARKELQYSDKTHVDQIWLTLRKAFRKYRESLNNKKTEA